MNTTTLDTSDETEGRALYRARANALAKAQLAMGKRKVRIVSSQVRSTTENMGE